MRPPVPPPDPPAGVGVPERGPSWPDISKPDTRGGRKGDHAQPNPVIGLLFGVLVIALVWTVVFIACWRFSEWLQA